MVSRIDKLLRLKKDLLDRVQKEYDEGIHWNDIVKSGEESRWSIHDLMKKDKEVIDFIREDFFGGANVSLSQIYKKIPPSSKLKTKLNEARNERGKPMSDQLYSLYYTYISSFGADKKQVYKFKGYYWSYMKNKPSRVPFDLTLEYPVLSHENPKATLFAKLTNFHDRTTSEVYSGYGYYSDGMNNLFIELHKDNEKGFEDAVYLIVSTSGNLDRLKSSIVRGVLTGVSAGSPSRPILSMEVVLIDPDSKPDFIAMVKSYLHSHKYSVRVRSTSLSNRFPVLSGKADMMNVTNSMFKENYDLVYYRLRSNNEVHFGTFGFKLSADDEYFVENISYNIVNNPTATKCYYDLEYNNGNVDIVLTEYSSNKLRELKLKMRLRWDVVKDKFKNHINGTCIFYEVDKFYISPVILYPIRKGLVERGQITFEEFLSDVKDKYGDEELTRLKLSLQNLYSTKVTDALYL